MPKSFSKQVLTVSLHAVSPQMVLKWSPRFWSTLGKRRAPSHMAWDHMQPLPCNAP